MSRAPLATACACASAMLACSSGSRDAPPATRAPPRDAGVAAGDAISVIAPFDPRSGMHLDDDSPPRVTGRPAPAIVRAHPIDVTLRSTPPGALAAVDGVPVGNTPSFWAGDANGREHEFTFVLGGYAVARYRFVPITSGVIHAHLDAVADEPDARDAGVDQVGPSWVAPSPIAPVAPPPPPTLVAPTPPRAQPAPVAPIASPPPDAAAPIVPAAPIAPPIDLAAPIDAGAAIADPPASDAPAAP